MNNPKKRRIISAAIVACCGLSADSITPPTSPPTTAPADQSPSADLDPFQTERFLPIIPGTIFPSVDKKASVPKVSRDATSLPNVSINNPPTITQDAKNAKTVTFTVTLSKKSTSTVTVKYSTSNGSAEAGDDYVAKSGTVTFAPGQTSKTITIKILPETKETTNEYFNINLSNSSGATIQPGKAATSVKIAPPPPAKTPVRPPHPTFG